MTTLADRCDELLDIAAAALASDRIDLVRDVDIRDIFQLATEHLEPSLALRDATIAQLKRELANVTDQLEVHQGIANGLARARALEVRDSIRAKARAAKAVGV